MKLAQKAQPVLPQAKTRREFLVADVFNSVQSEQQPRLTYALRYVVVYGCGVATTFYLTYEQSLESNVLIEKAYNYVSLNVVFASIAAFVLLTRVRVSDRYAKLCRWVGERSFLLFFIHVVVLEKVINSELMKIVTSNFPTIFVILSTAIATYLISLLVAAFLRLLPASKTFLG